MHYFIDGYNLLFRLMQFDDSLKKQRDLIIQDLNSKASLLHLNFTLVFDAYYRFGDGHRMHYDQLEILFTGHGESADEYILKALSKINNPRSEIVVTSDKYLASSVRRLQGKTETVEAFIKEMNQRYNKKNKTLLSQV